MALPAPTQRQLRLTGRRVGAGLFGSARAGAEAPLVRARCGTRAAALAAARARDQPLGVQQPRGASQAGLVAMQ